MAYVLEATGVTKQFGGLTAVNNVDLTIEEGSITSLIGPNGAGKTTFFNIVAGIYQPTKGVIRFNGEEIAGLKGNDPYGTPPHLMTKRGLARTYQNIRLFGSLSAIDNIMVGMDCRLKSGFWDSVLRLPRMRREEREAEDRAFELLEYVGLKGQENELARNLAYGEQRLLEIARAMASQPKLLLLDEPAAGMNPTESEDLRRLIGDLRTNRGLTVFLIEHDMKVVMNISDRVAVLDYGSKIADGTPQEVQSNPRVIEAYLGAEAGVGK